MMATIISFDCLEESFKINYTFTNCHVTIILMWHGNLDRVIVVEWSQSCLPLFELGKKPCSELLIPCEFVPFFHCLGLGGF